MESSKSLFRFRSLNDECVMCVCLQCGRHNKIAKCNTILGIFHDELIFINWLQADNSRLKFHELPLANNTFYQILQLMN